MGQLIENKTEKSCEVKLSSGEWCYLEKIDEDSGTIEFMDGTAIVRPVKNPGTYHYDNGGCLYREAVDVYNEIF